MSQTPSLELLERAMLRKVPRSKIIVQPLPMVPEVKLALIDNAYPQAKLTQIQIEYLMDDPPYWAFCWASGQVLARYLLDNPEEISGKTIVDFGSGSGIVAIAAAMAGAARSIALDLDENALLATGYNAGLNQTAIELSSNLDTLDVELSNALLLIADVFYDQDNIPLLDNFIRDYQDVIIADSRVKPEELVGMRETARFNSCTVPDLAETVDFNSVGIYRKCWIKH